MNFHYIKTFSLLFFWGGGRGGGIVGPQRDTLYPKSGADLGISREGADFQKKLNILVDLFFIGQPN